MPPIPAQDIGRAIEEAAAHYRGGRLDQAEKICARLLKLQPDLVDALHLLGLVKLQGGKVGAALGLLESALKRDPRSPQILANYALALTALDRDREALASLDAALAVEPGNVEAHSNRGSVLLKLNRALEALAAFDRATALQPGFLGAQLNRGNALASLGRYEEAVAQYDSVLASAPAHAETHVNRGNALSSLGRAAEAVAAYDRALAQRPDYIKALIGRGGALQAQNRHREAVADFDRVIARDRSNADAHHNAGLALLVLGDYRRGFEEHEWRWQRTGMPARRRNFGKPLWLGDYPLARKTILLHAEQGLGDTIQYARYAPMLARGGVQVVLEVPPALTALMARLDGVAAVVAQGDALPAFDVHCPLGSLPRALRTEPSAIPAAIPYLTASEDRIARWRPRIEAVPSPRIAVAWSGNADHPNDRNRSIALERLAPLFASAAGFVSIQHDLRDADAAVMARTPRLTHVGGELADFDDTAAVMALVDLVIAVDTSVVHLAGALGRPTWVLVPYSPDWRWMLDREDSPWYPTARLFRQSAPGDWDGVVAGVTDAVPAMR